MRLAPTNTRWCDDKSQVQALDRAQPGLPLRKRRAATMTNDYTRNGTTTLFAALDVLDGQIIGQCQSRRSRAVVGVPARARSTARRPKTRRCI